MKTSQYFPLTLLLFLLSISLTIQQETENDNNIWSDCRVQFPNPPYPCAMSLNTAICARYQLECFAPPCPYYEKEFPNGCLACNDPTVISYKNSPCEPGYENEEFFLENENEEWVCENEEWVLVEEEFDLLL